jgi:peptidylprolyl isomerase domain and WD repeat-containing protein 1
MSDSPDAPDASVLGKRVRNEAGQNENNFQASTVNSTVEDDSDDSDVGPMPMPAQAPAAKKKRRGIAYCQHSAF